jgi:hypothetical protein
LKTMGQCEVSKSAIDIHHLIHRQAH